MSLFWIQCENYETLLYFFITFLLSLLFLRMARFCFKEDGGVSISIIRCLLLAIFQFIWQSKCDTTITWEPSKTLMKYLANLTNKECSEVFWCHSCLLRDFEHSCGHCILCHSASLMDKNMINVVKTVPVIITMGLTELI